MGLFIYLLIYLLIIIRVFHTLTRFFNDLKIKESQQFDEFIFNELDTR